MTAFPAVGLRSMRIALTMLAAIPGNAAPAGHTATIQTPALRVVIVDNEPFGLTHRAGYNGVAELSSAAPGASNLFVPAYSGLNFEHIFSGDSNSYGWNIFEPRRAPMQLIRRSNNIIELHQARTQHWPLETRLTYEANGDAIDFICCATPIEDAWKKHGYIGLFFASYIYHPAGMSLHFIGRSRPGRGSTESRWIRHLPPKHGEAANHRPAGSNWDPSVDPGLGIHLVNGLSDLEYIYPFYYGLVGEDVFVMMFERPRAGGEVRFAQSPSGGGVGNPAWDYMFLQRDYAVNRRFCFRARAVWRKFTGRDDVIRLYEEWSGEKVTRPLAQ